MAEITWYPIKWNGDKWEGELPKDDGKVLLTIQISDIGNFVVMSYYVDFNKNFWIAEEKEMIIAWAKLPEPYELIERGI